MKLNIAKTPKDELIKRSRFRCIHGHNGIDHPNCYDQQIGRTERIGFLDIEAEDLVADYGIMFSYYIKVAGKNKFYTDHLTPADFKRYSFRGNGVSVEDTRIVRSLVGDLKNFDRVITHFGSIYDLSFVRTRAVICGVEFPGYGELYQTDTWRILRSKFKLRRNTLENGSLKLTGKTNKNHLSLNMKHGVLRGEKWAMDYCLDHNKKDVIDTERLYNKIQGFVKNTKSSI